jgi:hypothetical protein
MAENFRLIQILAGETGGARIVICINIFVKWYKPSLLNKIVNSLGSVFIGSNRQKYHLFKGSQEQPEVIERSL